MAKAEGIARVRLLDGSVHAAEIHWYEAHAIGKREYQLKLPLLEPGKTHAEQG